MVCMTILCTPVSCIPAYCSNLKLETPPTRFSFEQVNISSFIDRDLDENDLGGETLP